MYFRPPRPFLSREMPTRTFLARLAARGVPPGMLVGLEGCDSEEVKAAVENPDFPGLVEGAAKLRQLSHDERMSRLVDLACDVLQAAMSMGDLRACLFVLCERKAKRNAGRTLAEKVIEADLALTKALARAVDREMAPPTLAHPPPRSEPGRWPTKNGLDRQCALVEADLVRRLAAAEVAAATAPPARPRAPCYSPAVLAHLRKLREGAAGPVPARPPSSVRPQVPIFATVARSPTRREAPAENRPPRAAVETAPRPMAGWPCAP
ncbi:MAG: hypothetical protein U1E45_24850 [Geminicoccaceae bacterium]